MDKQATSSVDIGVQCEVQQREYIPIRIQSTFFHESEAMSQLYRSRTITSMALLLGFLYVASYFYQGKTLEESAKNGYMFACIAFCVYGMLYFPNTVIQRPHPAFWRLLQSWACAYFISIIFLLFLSPDQVQQFFKQFIDSKLGQPLPQKSYAEDCRIYTPEMDSKFHNILDSFDVFVPAHIMGWTVKMWILRDFKLAMLQQLIFEFMEITFRHWLPNFWECWWDHIILDILICNTGGILLGSWLMKKFSMKEYKWSLRTKNELSFVQNFKRLVISPQLDVQEWKVFSSVKRFLSVFWFIVFMNLCDLSFFFNKFILNINTSHNVMKFRTFPLGFYSIVAAREYYVYISDENVTRLGANAWLMFMIVLCEWILFFKNYNGVFTESFPLYVTISWIIIAILFIVVLIFIWVKSRKQDNKVKKQ